MDVQKRPLDTIARLLGAPWTRFSDRGVSGNRDLVIFDFDGTLADSWSVVADVLVAGADKLHYNRLSRSQVEALRSLPTGEVFRVLGISRWRMPMIVRHLRSEVVQSREAIELFPGIADMIRALNSAGILVAVVSSNAREVIETVIPADVMQRIARVQCGSSLFGKARQIARVIRRLRVEKDRTIVVGDETRDLDAAADVGILGLAVEWGYADAALLRNAAPGRTFETVEALSAELLMRAGHR